MQTAETNYKRIYGLTVKQIAERIMQREDNIYRIEVVRDVLDKYCEECANALIDGEKLNISGICLCFNRNTVISRLFGAYTHKKI